MTIKRFKKSSWPNSDGNGLDYIEYEDGGGRRIRTDGEELMDEYRTVSLEHCVDTYEELPCYAKDLIEGDIVVVEVNQKPTNYIWYVFESQQGGDNTHLAAVCLTHKGKYWDLSGHISKDIEVVALLGNAFDSERLTYGVKKYVK